MSTMNISLPESLKAFVDERVESGDYGTSSEYLRELIRRDKERLRFRKLIADGLESPSIGRADAKFWKSLERGITPRK